jgi:nitroreductase
LEFTDVVKLRRSIRRYKQDPVPDTALEKVFEAARLAPSGGNRQPCHLIVVKDSEQKKRLGIANWAEEAPVIIVGCTESTGQTDIAIAFEHLILAATDLGLGTCWIGRWGADAEIKKTLNIPDNIRVLAVTPIGYPAESPPSKPRKPMSQLVHREKF